MAEQVTAPMHSGDPPYKHSNYSYPSLMEVQIRRLRSSLEHWREVILIAKQVLLWEKEWYLTAILTTTAIVFNFLWLVDPSVLTVASVLGLCITICDYAMPYISSLCFKSERWTPRKEQELEDVCTNVVLYKAKMELAWGYYYRLKNTNRKLYFGITVGVLSLLAWIGCTFNNLFLAYLTVTFLLLLPGLEHSGKINKIGNLIHSFLEALKGSKVGKKD